MADPLSTPKASDAGFVSRFRARLGEGLRKRMPESPADAIFKPAPGVFEKPSSLIKGTFKLGRDFQQMLDDAAYSAAEAAGLNDPEMKLGEFEAKKELGKLFGGVQVKAVDTLLGGRTSSSAELPVPQPVVTLDGRTVLIRPGDLERLKLLNDQRVREGRPPIRSPLDPALSSVDPPTPARPVVPPTVPAVAPPAMKDTVAVARPNDKQPTPPGRPMLVRFIDP